MTNRSPLIPHLLMDAEDDRGIDFEFLAELTKRFDEEEELKSVLITTAEQLSQDLAGKTLNDDYKSYVAVCLQSLGLTSLLLLLSFL